MPDDEQSFEEIHEALRNVVGVMREAEIPFLHGGSLASWARGGPESRHDLDLMLKPEDAERALDAFERAGMRTERPPEGWLYKVWDGDVLIDLIFGPTGLEMNDETLERGEEMEVLSLPVRVMAIEDVIATKLLAMTDHTADFSSTLEIARAVREQVDWEAVRERTRDSPYAKAFLVLLEELEVID